MTTIGTSGTQAVSVTTIGTSGTQRLVQRQLLELLAHRGWVSEYYWYFWHTEAGSVKTIGTSGAQRLGH